MCSFSDFLFIAQGLDAKLHSVGNWVRGSFNQFLQVESLAESGGGPVHHCYSERTLIRLAVNYEDWNGVEEKRHVPRTCHWEEAANDLPVRYFPLERKPKNGGKVIKSQIKSFCCWGAFKQSWYEPKTPQQLMRPAVSEGWFRLHFATFQWVCCPLHSTTHLELGYLQHHLLRGMSGAIS